MGDCQLKASVLQQLAHLIGRQVGKLLHNAVWHVLWKRRYLHNTGCSEAQVSATPSFALELLGLQWAAFDSLQLRKWLQTSDPKVSGFVPENSSHVAWDPCEATLENTKSNSGFSHTTFSHNLRIFSQKVRLFSPILRYVFSPLGKMNFPAIMSLNFSAYVFEFLRYVLNFSG